MPRRRTAFADYLLPASLRAEDLLGRDGAPVGVRRCFSEKYEVARDRSKGKACFTLRTADGSPETASPFGNIEIEKCFSLKKDVLTVGYAITNRSGKRETLCFVPEINLSFAGEGEEYARFFACKPGEKDAPLDGVSGAIRGGTEGLKIQDLKNEVQINLSSVKPFSGCLALARSGELYQSSRIMPLFDLSLGSGETWCDEFSLKFSH
jgi:hypothetical protein